MNLRSVAISLAVLATMLVVYSVVYNLCTDGGRIKTYDDVTNSVTEVRDVHMVSDSSGGPIDLATYYSGQSSMITIEAYDSGVKRVTISYEGPGTPNRLRNVSRTTVRIGPFGGQETISYELFLVFYEES